ncbi:HET-domain-containing protein [Nemania serpens]|nr:HET-domain-containing protein [Nemania serpens]
MYAIKLCEFCSSINFEALRNPLTSDLPTLREGQVETTRHPFKDKRDDTHKLTLLGSFGDLRRRSKVCRLCQLFVSALSRQGAQQPGEKDVCHAETSFFGVYRDPKGGTYWNRRLSICVEIETDAYSIGGPTKSLFYAFQACDVGAASVQVDETFADTRPGVDMMIFGGRRRPLQLDLQWVRRWIDICRTDHGNNCERADIGSENKLERVRFVDVKQRCVITLEDVRLSECRYIALSYVWGGPQRIKLELHNKDEMAEPGVLAIGTLPQTIEDSILLTDALGFRNLWIDALCIVQDDDDDKKIQIEGMSQIYGFAFLTIVAASASTVEGGLPGLRPGSRSMKQEELMVIPPSKNGSEDGIHSGLSLMTALHPLTNPSEHYLERTPWNKRGWTMQERALSRRALVFLQEQVYWVCRETTFCEESYFENRLLRFHRFHEGARELTLRRSFRNFYEPDDDQARFWKTYQSLVANYTRRAFTYQGDAFDGFLSVLHGLSALSGDKFAWGLPRSHFEQSLLWSSFTSLRRRKEQSTLPMTSLQIKVPFPSWSWMGWIGEAHICIGDDRWDIDIGEVPEILCYEHYHAPLRLERVRHGTASYEWTARQNCPSWKNGHTQLVTLADIASEHPTLHSAKLSTIPETQLIYFWTSSAFFTLVPPDSDDTNVRQSIITDSRGDPVGSTGTMVSEDRDDGHYGRGRHEFVVLGSRRNQFSNPMLLVLQIEWLDGIAYRVNCGEIEEGPWEREPHTWKLIPLG